MAIYPRRITSSPTIISVSGGGIDFSTFPLQTWTEIPNSRFESTVKPLLDAAGNVLYRWGSDKVGAVMTNFNGMAWDFDGNRAWAHGGGHAGGSDNSVFKLDLNTMTWAIQNPGSLVGVDGFTAEDDLLWGSINARINGSWDEVIAAGGTPGNVEVRSYSRSSTGFAMAYGTSFSQFCWIACTGPARRLTTKADHDAMWAFYPANFQVPITGPSDIYTTYDLMPDGRPASRHMYSGQIYSKGRNELVYIVRALYRCKVDGTGWIRYQDGGRQVLNRYAGEYIWLQYDDQNDIVYKGGCSSDCYINGNYYYTNGVKFQMSTLAESDVSLVDASAFPNTIGSVNSGSSQMFSYKTGRWIGGVCSTGYGWQYNLDTGAKRNIQSVGTTFSGYVSERATAVYVPELGKLWAFNTNVQSLPCYEYDIDSPQAGGPFGTYTVQTRTKTFSNSAALPPNTGGLVYNRLTYWPQKKVVVYIPAQDTNVWVMRVV